MAHKWTVITSMKSKETAHNKSYSEKKNKTLQTERNYRSARWTSVKVQTQMLGAFKGYSICLNINLAQMPQYLIQKYSRVAFFFLGVGTDWFCVDLMSGPRVTLRDSICLHRHGWHVRLQSLEPLKQICLMGSWFSFTTFWEGYSLCLFFWKLSPYFIAHTRVHANACLCTHAYTELREVTHFQAGSPMNKCSDRTKK